MKPPIHAINNRNFPFRSKIAKHTFLSYNVYMITKKHACSFLCFATTLLLLFLSLHFMSLFSVSKWIGVSIGGGLFIISLIAEILLRKYKFIYFISIGINAIASGIAMSSLFVFLNCYPLVWHTALLFVSLCALFCIYCLCTHLPFFEHYRLLCIIVFTILPILSITWIVCTYHDSIWKLTMLSLIPFFAFLISIFLPAKDRFEHLKNISYCSFFALVFVILVVILILSEGDAIDGLDGGSIDFPSRKKKHPK